MCGLPAACGEKLPGRRHKVRGLCQAHADAVFGAEDPPWRRWDARTQRGITEEWLRSMTILAHGAGRPLKDLLAEIAAVNEVGTDLVRMASPLMPGEARDLDETFRALNRLHGREAMVHAITAQVLIGWCAAATGQTRGEVVQRLALALDEWLDGTRPAAGQG
jgi:hypothetical protein